MKEYKLIETSETGNLPAVVGMWGRIKGLIAKTSNLNKIFALNLTDKQEKVLTEVHDFLFQEVSFPELHDFLFQEINLFGWLKNKNQ